MQVLECKKESSKLLNHKPPLSYCTSPFAVLQNVVIQFSNDFFSHFFVSIFKMQAFKLCRFRAIRILPPDDWLLSFPLPSLKRSLSFHLPFPFFVFINRPFLRQLSQTSISGDSHFQPSISFPSLIRGSFSVSEKRWNNVFFSFKHRFCFRS